MTWNPKIYLNFEAERTRPAAELLSRIFVEAPKRVIDLGCGPGNSTALLAARWPQADLTGLDSSAEMLADARATGIKAHWEQADVARWQPRDPYGVIFSNATLQWLPDHAALLPRLISFVKDGGVFAFQIPRNFGGPSHTLIQKTIESRAWSKPFDTARYAQNVKSAADYFDILEPHVRHIDLWETTYMQALSGGDAVFRWMSGTGLRPFANRLDGEEREEFLDGYRKRVAKAYPQRASGVTLYPFQRLFAVARR